MADNTPDSTTTVIDAPCGTVRAHRSYAPAPTWRALGIPYATAARFEAPSPVARLAREFDATTPAPLSPQSADTMMSQVDPDYLERQGLDEHCQRLSVTWPAEAGSEPRPVIVWIHGGSYVTGGGDLPAFDPSLMVAENGVIMVSVTYRLGVLGFLGGEGFAPANLGLLDLAAALTWVRDNIAAFGGDPDNVTAMGQSAGADAIVSLMASEEAAGLFRRAIVQSAPLGIAAGRAPMRRHMLGAARAAGVDGSSSVPELLDAQRAITRAARGHGLRSVMPFGPQWGYRPLPPERDRAAATASSADIDLMIGHLDREGAILALGSGRARRIFTVPVVGPALLRLVGGALASVIYARPARRFARAHRAAGGRALRYVLRWRAAGSPVADGHAMDLPLLMGDPDLWTGTPLLGNETSARVLEVGARLRAVWASFARDGGVPSERARAVADVLRLSER